MAHVPHLLMTGPWDGPRIDPGDAGRHHLAGVLRLAPGDSVSYTDGAGRMGEGRWLGDEVERGVERSVPPPAPAVTVAVAAPDARDRQRFLVEKLTEIGVVRIRWLKTSHGGHRPPRPPRAQQWADAALEQCRGAFRTHVDQAACRIADIEPPVLVAERGGPASPGPHGRVTVLVGPEGGWAPGETDGLPTLGLGERVLRVETAALLAAFALRG